MQIEAEKAAREAIRLQPSSPAAQYHLGRAPMLQGRYQEAIAAFRRSNELRGNYADIGMAQLSLAQGNYDQQIVYLQNDEGRDSAISLYWLGAAYAGKGDQEKALLPCKSRSTRVSATSPQLTRLPTFLPCVLSRASSR